MDTLELIKQLLMRRSAPQDLGTPDLPARPRWTDSSNIVPGIDAGRGYPVPPKLMEEDAMGLARTLEPHHMLRPMRPQDTMGIEEFDRNFNVFGVSPEERGRLMEMYLKGLRGFTSDLVGGKDPFDTRVPPRPDPLLKKP